MRDIILKYYLQNRMLNEIFPTLKLLLRTTADIEPHLLKRGSGLAPGDPNCSALRGLPPSISRGTGSEQPHRERFFGEGCQGTICEKEEITQVQGLQGNSMQRLIHVPAVCWSETDWCVICLGKSNDERLPWAAWWQHEGEGSSGRGSHLQTLGGQSAGCFCESGMDSESQWGLSYLERPADEVTLVETVCEGRTSRTRHCSGENWVVSQRCTAPYQVTVQGGGYGTVGEVKAGN